MMYHMRQKDVMKLFARRLYFTPDEAAGGPGWERSAIIFLAGYILLCLVLCTYDDNLNDSVDPPLFLAETFLFLTVVAVARLEDSRSSARSSAVPCFLSASRAPPVF